MRIPIFRFPMIVALVLLVLAPEFSRAESIVYDTTSLSVGLGSIAFTSTANQFGNQITLDGSQNANVITDFDFFYQGFAPLPDQQLDGQGTVTIRFWANDGAINGGLSTPGTLLYQSTSIPILS